MRKTNSNTHANRGAVLERLVDMTNTQYRNKGIADIRKIPTPVQIQSNVRGKVTGYTQKPEWVDYCGVHDGRAIVFDAKETANRTSFPLNNISEHQFQLLKSWHQKGAYSFLLVSFSKLDEVYLLPFSLLETFWEDALKGGRKSIPHSSFIEQCDLIKSEKGYVLHYLKHVGNCGTGGMKMNAEQARQNVESFMKKRNYTYSVESALEFYTEYYKKGYYISHSMKDCVKHLERELEFLAA